MDILIINKRPPFDGLGAERVIWELGKRYAREGHAVTFFCPAPADAEPPDIQNVSFRFVETSGDVTRRQIEFFVRGPPKYPGVYCDVEPDLVYDNPSPFLFHLAHYYGDAPVVSKVHTIYRRQALIAKDHWLVKLGTLVGDESYRLLRNELLTPVSASTAGRLERLLHDSNTVVTNPNGIQLPDNSGEISTDTNQVLYLSKLGRKKGILTLLDAWADVERRHPEAELTVAGTGPLEQQAKARAEELGLTAVSFEGYVSEQRKSELFLESLLFALPTHIEGMPLTVIEAMAHECAVVSTDTYGVRDVVEDGTHGVLVDPGDPDQLAAALSQCLSATAESRAFGTQARSRATEFQLEDMLDRELQIVDDWLATKTTEKL